MFDFSNHLAASKQTSLQRGCFGYGSMIFLFFWAACRFSESSFDYWVAETNNPGRSKRTMTVPIQIISAFLWFDKQAEEVAGFYTSIKRVMGPARASLAWGRITIHL
jgi:hypothetical protein